MEEALREVKGETCLDFLYFRQLLLKSRSLLDDNINQRLNTINTANLNACRQLLSFTSIVHNTRKDKLELCIKTLRERVKALEETVNYPHANILRKEVGLLESELIVEEIVKDRTLGIIYSKCRPLGPRPSLI